MKLRKSLRALGCALIGATMFAALPALAQEKKPNVMFILADNVGYGDMGPYRLFQLARLLGVLGGEPARGLRGVRDAGHPARTDEGQGRLAMNAGAREAMSGIGPFRDGPT